jgi:hypothetical protein
MIACHEKLQNKNLKKKLTTIARESLEPSHLTGVSIGSTHHRASDDTIHAS